MAFNLLRRKWIPVMRKSGRRDVISPWQITSADDDPIISLNYPRADFNGSMIQFIIALIQFCLMPDTPREWRKYFLKPPSEKELRNEVLKKEYAFNLIGDGGLFMQDYELNAEDGTLKQIGSLFIDAPGDNTIKNNADIFIKRGGIEKVCPACAAVALITLHCNAPSGGQGHRVSIRGGGPLTTLVLGETLWEIVWNNVLLKEKLDGLGMDFNQPEAGGCFPWMAPSRLSDQGEETLPSDVHPLHVFWAMPRRIRLLSEENQNIECDACGNSSDIMTKEYLTKARGYNYNMFVHPLTPYKWSKDNEPLSLKGSNVPDGLGYRHWIGIVDADHDEKNRKTPALAVQVFRDERLSQIRQLVPGRKGPDFRIWAFGFETDKMKARFWHEGTMPILDIVQDKREKYASLIKGIVECAGHVQQNLNNALRKGLFHDKKDVKRNNSLLKNSDSRFWKETDQIFYNSLRQLRHTLENDQDTVSVREEWLKRISRRSEAIFNELTQSGPFTSADPKRIAIAWDAMRKSNSRQNKKIIASLDLPQADGSG